jgi:ubiquinone/menaquinone biosynthesis C-methylase UbiE
MPTDHGDVLRREFARQAETFVGEDSFFANVLLAEWIIGNLTPLDPGDTVLEVACSAARRTSASTCRHGYARSSASISPRRCSPPGNGGSRSTASALLQQGDVTDLPFVSGSFDLVVCRFAVHHVDQPEAAIAELSRVCRDGGRVGIVDMVAGAHALVRR